VKTKPLRFLRWTPRMLGLLFAAFISLFALDVFDGQQTLAQTLWALLLHLIPTALLLSLVVIAWRWERIGAIGFAALGLFYVVAFWGRFHWATYCIIAGPLLLIAALLIISWRCQTRQSLPKAAVEMGGSIN
jgi:hypothetical protein